MAFNDLALAEQLTAQSQNQLGKLPAAQAVLYHVVGKCLESTEIHDGECRGRSEARDLIIYRWQITSENVHPFQRQTGSDGNTRQRTFCDKAGYPGFLREKPVDIA